MRLYRPKGEALDGKWTAPLQRVTKGAAIATTAKPAHGHFSDMLTNAAHWRDAPWYGRLGAIVSRRLRSGALDSGLGSHALQQPEVFPEGKHDFTTVASATSC
jgi:hypothetical protein